MRLVRNSAGTCSESYDLLVGLSYFYSSDAACIGLASFSMTYSSIFGSVEAKEFLSYLSPELSSLVSETRYVFPLDLLLPCVSTLSFPSGSASFLSVSRGVCFDRTDSMSLIVSASIYGFLNISGSAYALPFGLFSGLPPKPSALI